MKRHARLCCALLLAAGSAAGSAVVPDPMRQLNAPVIGLGEAAWLDLEIPAYAGGESTAVAYSVHLDADDDEVRSGYHALRIECPPEFQPNLYPEHRGGVCFRIGASPHPATRMRVFVFNDDAADGLTEWHDALRVTDGSVPGGVRSPLRLYGVRP